ncbi:LamG-like jellyroll fold domain-containing protein, partial [Filomicrobium sp.]|uniref:LamG-like jellyroll fold domain-containing protein n=1 Tax=Filomicrobium sp. TaxID=2024831 RepID=UPI0025835CE1
MRGGMLVLLLGALLLAVPAANAADGYTVANGATTTINEHGYCRKVTNNIVSGLGIFVPTKYNYEWFNNAVSFVSSTPAGVMLAECLDAVSLRFDESGPSYLTRTTSSAGDRRTWTYSAWVKRSRFGARQILFNAQNGGADYEYISIQDNDTLFVRGREKHQVATVAVYRDPAAWYHVVVAKDTTLATGTDRVKVYVNGVRQELSWSVSAALNEQSTISSNSMQHFIGSNIDNNTNFGGYLADVYFVDGLALDPTSFGQYDPTTLQWVPKTYSGAYGTNGFHLNFNIGTSLGNDSSGNGNHWTPNNVTTTAGPNYDPMRDYMTSFTSEGWGNTATLNPLHNAGTTLGT